MSSLLFCAAGFAFHLPFREVAAPRPLVVGGAAAYVGTG